MDPDFIVVAFSFNDSLCHEHKPLHQKAMFCVVHHVVELHRNDWDAAALSLQCLKSELLGYAETNPVEGTSGEMAFAIRSKDCMSSLESIENLINFRLIDTARVVIGRFAAAKGIALSDDSLARPIANLANLENRWVRRCIDKGLEAGLRLSTI